MNDDNNPIHTIPNDGISTVKKTKAPVIPCNIVPAPSETTGNDNSRVEELHDSPDAPLKNSIKLTDEAIVDEIDPETLTVRDIFDFSISSQYRLRAIDLTYNRNPDDIFEVLNRLRSMYDIASVSSVGDFLSDIALHSRLPVELRLLCAESLCDPINLEIKEKEHKFVDGLECLYTVCTEIEHLDKFPMPLYVDKVLFLLKYGVKKVDSLFYNFIDNNVHDCFFRYKTILSVEAVDRELGLQSTLMFIDNPDNDIKFRILACQNILATAPPETSTFQDCAARILAMAQDDSLTDNRRADAADVILHHINDPVFIEQAMSVLQELGGATEGSSIYANAQNVHTVALCESSLKNLEYLSSLNLKLGDFTEVIDALKHAAKLAYRGRQVYGQCTVYDKDCSENEITIHNSLDRITVDRTVFTHNYNLRRILTTVYSFIETCEDCSQLKTRLLEELVDMSDTCTSGYISRLINALSGFMNLSLQISWEEQIIANLNGRLNALIKTKDEDSQELILNGLTSTDLAVRAPFLRFFRENVSAIRNEMYEEFKDYINDTEFDLYCVKAILNYEK